MNLIQTSLGGIAILGLVASMNARAHQTHPAHAPHQAAVQAVKASSKVDLNTADAKTIAKVVKGIGPKTAEAIVAYREEHGKFKSLDDLRQVKARGIKRLFAKQDNYTHLKETLMVG